LVRKLRLPVGNPVGKASLTIGKAVGKNFLPNGLPIGQQAVWVSKIPWL
jgi:hypothetical protein